jgi:hypothetical protein
MRGANLWPEVFMAIQDYVRSIAATETVSKDQVFRFLELIGGSTFRAGQAI